MTRNFEVSYGLLRVCTHAPLTEALRQMEDRACRIVGLLAGSQMDEVMVSQRYSF